MSVSPAIDTAPVEDLAGNTGDVIVTFAGEYSYWSTDSMWLVPEGAMLLLPEGVEPGGEAWPDPEDPGCVPAVLETWLRSVTTGTGGIYQLPRSDEEERVLDWPYTYLSASGRFPPMGGWPDYRYFEAGVSIIAGPASASAQWWNMPPGMAEPETKERPAWAQATGGVINLTPPTMSIRSRTPGLWPSSASGGVQFYNEAGMSTVDGVCVAKLRSIIAIRLEPDIVDTGLSKLRIGGWFGPGVMGQENVEVEFRKSDDDTVTLTPTWSKVVYPKWTHRDVFHGIICHVDFTEPPGKDYTGLWDVWLNVGEVQDYSLYEALRVEKLIYLITDNLTPAPEYAKSPFVKFQYGGDSDQLGLVGIPSLAREHWPHGAAANFCEIVGVARDHRTGDEYRWERRASRRGWKVTYLAPDVHTMALVTKVDADQDNEYDPSPGTVEDLVPSPEQNKVYDFDAPRIIFGAPGIFDWRAEEGEAMILKHSFVQRLYRRRGLVEGCIGQMQWRSKITIRCTGPGAIDWQRVATQSTNFIEEGWQYLTISPEDAQKAIKPGVTVLPILPEMNEPQLTVPGDP